jgi:hypothetical protein
MGRAGISPRLLIRLRAHKLVPPGTQLKRTNASRSQRDNGAWAWSAYPEPGKGLGSHYPMEVVLTCTDWRISETELGVTIDPCGKCMAKYGKVRFWPPGFLLPSGSPLTREKRQR